MEQVVICLCHVDENFEPHEDFISLHAAPLLNQICCWCFQGYNVTDEPEHE